MFILDDDGEEKIHTHFGVSNGDSQGGLLGHMMYFQNIFPRGTDFYNLKEKFIYFTQIHA